METSTNMTDGRRRSGLHVLLVVCRFSAISTWAEERMTTDLDTSTIMRTVGSVVCRFC
jgi:hypothetical protein